MRDNITRRSVVFDDLLGKQIVAKFDQPDSSSDGGAMLLKACDERLGLTKALAECMVDKRQPGKVAHSLQDLVRQCVFAIACGYEDCNDAQRLADDPMQKTRQQGPRLNRRRWPWSAGGGTGCARRTWLTPG